MTRKKIKTEHIKLGHRESAGQHDTSDTGNRSIPARGHHKASSRSGGGGHVGGGGGKKGRPALRGWEKGDVVRDVDLASSPFLLRVKSSKRLRAK